MSAFSGLDMMGFDRAANWQMVPEGGFRPIELMDGAGLDLDIVPAEGKTAISLKEGTSIPGFMSRSLTVMGLAPGNATITAATKTPDPRSHQVPGSGRSARLDVSVLPKGIQKLKFYRVKDQGGHIATRSDASIEPMLKFAKEIYLSAANVELQKVGSIETIELPGTQPDEFWFRPAEVQLLKSKVQLLSADLHIFLMWSIEVDLPEMASGGNICGFCPRGTRMCAIEDDAAHGPGISANHTLAHEIGHHFFLSHDDPGVDKDNLMFFNAKSTSTSLVKNQILEINRRAVAGAPAPPPADAAFR